jgi:uncharacterized protein YndB with AHSA1/START domain
MATASTTANDRELIITRVFNVARSLLFRMWTDAEHTVHWMAPPGLTIMFNEADVRPGGTWRVGMRGPDGAELWVGGVYREVVPPERLAFTHAWDGAGGKPGPETLVTVTFADRNGRAEMTFRQSGFDSVESRDGHAGGWGQCFDLLDDYLRTSATR